MYRKFLQAIIVPFLLLWVLNGPTYGQVTIDFWHAMEGPKAPVMNEMAKDFTKENPGIKVNVSLKSRLPGGGGGLRARKEPAHPEQGQASYQSREDTPFRPEE